MNKNKPKHTWRFFRSGGFDQVRLETANDLQNLSDLDPKLWTVLNCPTTGLEFDARTAALLDTDGDGQIRVPEILAAVKWSCERLVDAGILFQSQGLPVSAIADHDAEGAGIKAAALTVLQYMGKTPDDALQVSDFSDMTRLFSPNHFNGDGVVAAELTDDADLRQLIAEILDTQGGTPDRSGVNGVTTASVSAFYAQAQAVLDWHKAGADGDIQFQPLGDKTAEAVAVFEKAQAKVDDYFVRCKLAAFDTRAVDALNPAPSVYAVLNNRAIAQTDVDVSALPLAAVGAGQSLPLGEGINPAWSSAIQNLLHKVIVPLLGETLGQQDSLSAAQWADVSARLSAWRTWQAARPDTAVHKLGVERLQAIVAGEGQQALAALIERDLAAKSFGATVDAVEKLVRFQRDLVTLLQNFVSLSDFYRGEEKAIFQAGTLYLDQRSCELVMRVNDMGRHATMAPFSGCYLVYCTCERKGEAPLSIVAALTGGDVDELMVPGRNGIFYDRQGRDWRATVNKVVAQPVSLRQAFWSPYKRVATFIETQLQNFAASRDKDIEAKTTAGVTNVAAPKEAASNFDIAKFAGIFAAIGLAVGAIGTSLAAVAAGLFSLAWWQIPLVLVGVMLLISGPSVFMAYLTLRRRNLGPLLDANGWAVNTRARINVPFGASLTGLAELPAGASRSLVDPFAEKKRPWKTWVVLSVVVVAVVVLWYQGMFASLLG
ncbi:hypothetical protein E3V39_06035 [Gammaproteobacteria bacterium LSUCC0112]|nr:hypothetical protein E3V39_06035 [Gammaproteobacteria bacterium LSUCC0112]